MQINIDPKKRLFRWGPIDGKPIYPDYWYGGFSAFNKRYKPGWPAVIFYFCKEKFVVVVDFVCLHKNGEEIFKNHILPDDKFLSNWKRWNKLIVKLWLNMSCGDNFPRTRKTLYSRN